jgi:hypothetical protein
MAVWDPPRRRSATVKGAVMPSDDASHPALQAQRSQSVRCDLRPTPLVSGVAHLCRFHRLVWDPYEYPYSVDCRHPRAAHDVMFNGPSNTRRPPVAPENARTAPLKTAGGKPSSGFNSRARYAGSPLWRMGFPHGPLAPFGSRRVASRAVCMPRLYAQTLRSRRFPASWPSGPCRRWVR